MAIKVVNSRYPGFIFDGENSRDYGVYITDVEVFGAPKRNVEMISIPGRNGNYALDKGSFDNIPVKYKCVLGAGTEEDFNNGISDFRNWLASKVGYKTLSDEINLGEYRKGVFLEGMDVPTLNKKTGTFEVVFDCMPQRWLDDASSLPVEMASGGDIFNPTLFESSPLLSVWGYGDIHINDDVISINDDVIGDYLVQSATPSRLTARIQINLPANKLAQLNAGDAITTTITIEATQTVQYRDQSSSLINSAVPTVSSGTASAVSQIVSGKESKTTISIPAAFSFGTSASFEVRTDIALEGFVWGTGSFSDAWYERTTVAYDGNNTITITTGSGASGTITGTADAGAEIGADEVRGNSTKSALGEPLYFDMEIGEAYKEENGEYISVNNAVSFPTILPTLKPAHNTITFDNTVDKLVITPRWYKV